MELQDVFAIVAAILTTAPSIWRIWRMRQPTDAVNVNSDSLVMPLLQVPEVNFPVARRLQCWQFSIILHSFTAILCVWKDDHTTIARYCGPAILFACSIGQLGFLLWHYPVTEDVFTIWLNICLGCWFYLLLIFTDFIYFKDSHISITLEILMIAFTVCMHALRALTDGLALSKTIAFRCFQIHHAVSMITVDVDMFEFEWLRLTVAVVGCFPGVLTLFSLHDLFSKPDTTLLFSKPDTVLLDPILDGHIIFKARGTFSVSTIIGALFRLLDVIFVCVPATRKAANYLLGKLQECFN